MIVSPPALLEPDEPSAARVVGEGGASDFVLTADHAGNAVPRRLDSLGVSAAELDRHIGWDIGISGVTERLSANLDAPAVLQPWSRLVIDCNRDPSWPSSIPEISEFTEIPGNRGLTQADRSTREMAIFRPYHDRIAALLDQRQAAGKRSIFIAMHSFTPVFKNEARAVEVAILYEQKTRLASIMLDLLRAEGDLVVGENEPYSITKNSDYSVPAHAMTRGLDYLEIEIRQDLIATPSGQAAWAEGFARLLTAALQLLDAAA